MQLQSNEQGVTIESIINKTCKIFVDPMYGEALYTNLDKKELNAIQENDIDSDSYTSAGKKFIYFLEPPINGFIRVLQTKYGQYWIEPVEWHEEELLLGLFTKNVLHLEWFGNDEKWHDITPTSMSFNLPSTITKNPDEFNFFLTKSDWFKLEYEINKPINHSFAASMLSRAYMFFDEKKYREAYIEGVTALELALTEVIRQFGLTKENDLEKEKNQLRNLTISAQTVIVCRFVFNMSIKDVNKTQKAIDTRNKLVHQGKSIDEKDEKQIEELRQLINTIAILLFNNDHKQPTLNIGNLYL